MCALSCQCRVVFPAEISTLCIDTKRDTPWRKGIAKSESDAMPSKLGEGTEKSNHDVVPREVVVPGHRVDKSRSDTPQGSDAGA